MIGKFPAANMKRELIKIFFFILKLLVTRSVQLDIINDKYKEAIQTEVLPATISRIIAIKNQLRVFDESIEDVSAKSSSFFTFTSNNLNEFMGLTQETTLGSNRGAFVIYDTNDYPFACMCNSAQYQNWISAGKDPNTKVECANTINTGIFNSNDIDYCDPTNVAASQSS